MKMIRGGFRAAVLIGAAASVLALAGGANAQNLRFDDDSWQFGNPSPNDNTWPYATTGKSPVLAVVGDIACQPGGEISTSGSVIEPAGESKSEFCFNPKAPYTNTSLWQSQEATANQIETMKPNAVAILGDLQYQVGQFSDFEQSYDLTYGAFKFITRPSPGNHEFYDEHGETGVAGYGYFSYFNGFQINTNNTPTTTASTITGTPAQPIMTTLGDPCPSSQTGCGYPAATTPNAQPIPRSDGQAGHFEQTGGVGATVPAGGPVGVGDGWYSYNLGGWHLISLNIECETQPGACSGTGSWLAAELAWLKKDLEENRSACTLAYWHQPTYSPANGISEEGITAQAFWQLLYDYNADLVLNGHDHLYARYRPLNASGKYDPKKGIREFVVGTGGETLDTVVTTPVASGSGETNLEDPSGNTSFNAENIEAATGNYWGVMALTLDPNGYKWDFESALPLVSGAAPYSDKGVATCHGGPRMGW